MALQYQAPLTVWWITGSPIDPIGHRDTRSSQFRELNIRIHLKTGTRNLLSSFGTSVLFYFLIQTHTRTQLHIMKKYPFPCFIHRDMNYQPLSPSCKSSKCLRMSNILPSSHSFFDPTVSLGGCDADDGSAVMNCTTRIVLESHRWHELAISNL